MHWVTKTEYYYDSKAHIAEYEDGCFWGFPTNRSWSTGLYLVTATLIDHISKHVDEKYTYFTLE